MFSRAVQPPILSLFSSTSTECLSLFSVHTDPSLLSDSFVHVLDDESSQPEPPPPKTLIIPIVFDDAAGREGDTSNTNSFSISGPVLHIQSPTLRSGYIRCPPTHWRPDAAQRDRDLGIKLGWIHVQVRNMGREWCFEVGVVDQTGREGRIRCSTFQTQPSVRTGPRGSPVLHVPFRFPSPSSRPLTAWSTISQHIPSLMSRFSSVPPERTSPHAPLPSGQFSHISFVKVYATCRLRRIWFTAEKLDASQEPWEFGLYTR
ncbi:hypothetical protein JB92DRAFT_2746173 [Gautieria morchelliformis]|nr:hypothetical protein JB92DRAFT_2746173 [Gautieria morchelliformis]